jgi:HAD superfamily hydrolase (TIGR01450 family)
MFLRSELGPAARHVFVIGSPSLRAAIEDEQFEVLDGEHASDAQVVLVGGHEHFGYGELLAATRAIADGARLFGTNRDPMVPTRHGPAPATGAILAAVETASGVRATTIGKPEPYMFEVARAALAGCNHVAVVGDSLTADIRGGKRAGLGAILVLSGATRRSDLDAAGVEPDFIFDDLRGLAAALESSVVEPGR